MLGRSIATEDLLKLCNEIYLQRKTYDLPWSQKIKDVGRFTKDNGPLSYGKVKVPGVYILFLPDESHTYVGQSVNLALRIRTHLSMSSKSVTKMALSKLKETQTGQVQTCIVDKETVDILVTKYSTTLSDFLLILEQYIILLTAPSLNKLSVVTDRGHLSYQDRVLANPMRHPLFIYKV